MRSLDRAGEHDYSIYDMRHAWVAEIAEVLDRSVTPAAGRAPPPSRSLPTAAATAWSCSVRRASALLRLAQSLDVPSSRSANSRVIRLRHGDAKTLAATLGRSANRCTASGARDGRGSGKRGLLVRADESLNALVILADPEDVGLLETSSASSTCRARNCWWRRRSSSCPARSATPRVQWALRSGHVAAALASPTAGCPSAPCWARCRPASRRQSCPTVR